MVRNSLIALTLACCAVAGLVVGVVPGAAHINHVEADAQHSADGTLLLEWQFVGADGWVVVRADDDGEPGEPLGHKRVSSESGFQTDTNVSVSESAWADIEGSQKVWVVLHREGEGEGFDIDDDPMIESFGQPAGTRVTIEKADESARVAAQGFSPETVENGSVTVRRAELPTEGFLAVHQVDADSASDLEESDIGSAVGVVSLDAGVHENVTLELDDSYLASADEQELLFATVYRGDEPFDPESAEQLTAGETTVGTTFGVRLPAENASTATPTPEEADLVNTPPPTETPPETASADDAETEGNGAGIGIVGGILAVLATLLAARRRP